MSMGAWVGAILTAGLVSMGFLGWKLFDLPFAPFDFFDWLTRALPGGVVTLGIDTLVIVSRTLHPASTSAAAKLVEQNAAIGLTLFAGTAIGALAFALLRASDEAALLFGGVLGAMAGALAVITANRLDRIAPGDGFVSGTWLVSEFLAWGLALGWLNDRLREEPESADAGRRAFLHRVGGGLALLTIVGAVGGAIANGFRKVGAGVRWSDTNALPNADATVKAVPGTRPELTAVADHYRVDADTRPPAIDARRWRLQISGLVDPPTSLTLDELRALQPLHQLITLSCVSNPLGGDLIDTTRWTGVSLQTLLRRTVPSAAATHLRVRSADTFWEVVALDTIRNDDRVMLAYAWDGVPLPTEHGFPLRLYVPNLYGMKQPKWITAIDVIDHWEAGFWVSRGWDREGRMETTSVIDVITIGPAKSSAQGAIHAVTAGGIAPAGARGISRVEVRADDGEWREALLRTPLSPTTWVIWRAELTLPGGGEHVVTVRCYDSAGLPQSGDLHTRRVTVPAA
jgi:DMSO/TMAO reductase YedYZ molybdopterin-dependent catalytic subunit